MYNKEYFKYHREKLKNLKKCRNHPNRDSTQGTNICKECLMYHKNYGKYHYLNNKTRYMWRRARGYSQKYSIPFNITEQDIKDILPKECPVFHKAFNQNTPPLCYVIR